MTVDREKISLLVSRYLDGVASPEENAELETAIQQDAAAAEIFYDLSLQHVQLHSIARTETGLPREAQDCRPPNLPLPPRFFRNRLRASPRTLWVAMVASILLCFSLALPGRQLFAPSEKSKTVTLVPSGPDITLLRSAGVTLVTESTPLMNGDQIIVPPHSRGKLCWRDNCHLSLHGYANVTFHEEGDEASRGSRVFLNHGAIHAHHTEDASAVHVETPQIHPSRIFASKLTVVVEGGETYVKVHTGDFLAVRKKDRGEHQLANGDELIIAGLEPLVRTVAHHEATGQRHSFPASTGTTGGFGSLCGAVNRLDGVMRQSVLSGACRSSGSESKVRGQYF